MGQPTTHGGVKAVVRYLHRDDCQGRVHARQGARVAGALSEVVTHLHYLGAQHVGVEREPLRVTPVQKSVHSREHGDLNDVRDQREHQYAVLRVECAEELGQATA